MLKNCLYFGENREFSRIFVPQIEVKDREDARLFLVFLRSFF